MKVRLEATLLHTKSRLVLLDLSEVTAIKKRSSFSLFIINYDYLMCHSTGPICFTCCKGNIFLRRKMKWCFSRWQLYFTFLQHSKKPHVHPALLGHILKYNGNRAFGFVQICSTSQLNVQNVSQIRAVVHKSENTLAYHMQKNNTSPSFITCLLETL